MSVDIENKGAKANKNIASCEKMAMAVVKIRLSIAKKSLSTIKKSLSLAKRTCCNIKIAGSGEKHVYGEAK